MVLLCQMFVNSSLYTIHLSLIISKHKGIKFHFYADGRQVYMHLSLKNVSAAFEKLNRCLDDFKGWMSRISRQLAPADNSPPFFPDDSPLVFKIIRPIFKDDSPLFMETFGDFYECTVYFHSVNNILMWKKLLKLFIRHFNIMS